MKIELRESKKKKIEWWKSKKKKKKIEWRESVKKKKIEWSCEGNRRRRRLRGRNRVRRIEKEVDRGGKKRKSRDQSKDVILDLGFV